ncbi:MAG: DUF2071 domain-containing protein [Saprospiraceae bacterium]
MEPIFLKAAWKNLIMANYAVEPSILLPFLPAHTELDFWNGQCYISLVGFMFLNTRVLGISIPFHRNFEEVNLRFYVRCKDGDEWKRGVVFIKEIVPKWAISLVANTFYGEKYIALPMQNTLENQRDGSLSVSYGWEMGGAWDELKVETLPYASELAPGSEEEFITQHYWGYTKLKGDRTSEYQVEHPSWKVYQVKDYYINVSGERLYGKEFGEILKGKPDSVFMAEGSEILVRKGKMIS